MNTMEIKDVKYESIKAANGNHIRLRTVVTFTDNVQVNFLDKLSKKEARAQAIRRYLEMRESEAEHYARKLIPSMLPLHRPKHIIY